MATGENGRDTGKLSVQLNEAFERLENQEKSAPPASSGGSGSSPFGLLSLLFALIAIGAASYAVYVVQFRKAESPPATQLDLTRVERDLQAKIDGVNDLRGRLDEVSSKLAQMEGRSEETMAHFQSQVDTAVAEIKSEIGTSSKDWLFAEVEYLLRLGNQRVIMERDATDALALFQAADDILRESEGIAAYDLRASLANDIAALEAVQEVDVDGIFVRLAALSSRVSTLRQRTRSFEAAPVVDQVAPAPDDYLQRFMDLLARGGTRLAGLVDFRTGQEKVKPILPANEEYYLRQNLVMKLQMAQLGLLRSDEAVYRDALAEAQSWIVEYFDPDDPATTTMLTALKELQLVPIATRMPDVSGSLREVRKLLERFHRTPPRNGGAPDA
ncbi:MAG: uroporphyrinogen-III C-methyltransferase [Pseudomonadales bacterium]|nr:uroporphyrinogen-III C-methyltransferase [Pseudomonadales bacterium]